MRRIGVQWLKPPKNDAVRGSKKTTQYRMTAPWRLTRRALSSLHGRAQDPSHWDPWYRREDWDALRALFIDAAKLPATYDQWLRKAEHAEKQFKRQGSLTGRVYLDPIEFSLWCVDRGTDLDAAARMNFASEAVARKYRNQT
jgi:hypothetical protein